MDGLAEIVASREAEHGALTEQEIEAAHQELFGDEGARDTARAPREGAARPLRGDSRPRACVSRAQAIAAMSPSPK
ncbi:hypothetical protein [Streptomyces sp. Ac-502]|uniref:hypothetical protein n=1 Tax=Streptomyces sp. Ac-502 TaxID=3342801 RepID=UPI0038625AD9